MPQLEWADVSTPVPNARQSEFPAKAPAPLLPTAVSTPPSGDQWIHEVKVDGYRMLARLDAESVSLISKRQVDWTAKFQPVVDELAKLNTRAVLDGELTILSREAYRDIAVEVALRPTARKECHVAHRRSGSRS